MLPKLFKMLRGPASVGLLFEFMLNVVLQEIIRRLMMHHQILSVSVSSSQKSKILIYFVFLGFFGVKCHISYQT